MAEEGEDLEGVVEVDSEEDEEEGGEIEEEEEVEGAKTVKGASAAEFSALLLRIHAALGTKTFTPRILQQQKLLPAGQRGVELFAELMKAGYFEQDARRSWTHKLSAVALLKVRAEEDQEKRREAKRKKQQLQQSAALAVLKEIRDDLQTHRLEVYGNLNRWYMSKGQGRFPAMLVLRQVLNVLCRGRTPVLRLEGDDIVYIIIMVPKGWPPLRHQPQATRLPTGFGTGPWESPFDRAERLRLARERNEALRQAEESRLVRELDAALRGAAERRGDKGNLRGNFNHTSAPTKGGGRIVIKGWDEGDDFNEREAEGEV